MDSQVIWQFNAKERKAFDLYDNVSTTSWAESQIYLPPSISEFHGPWRAAVAPYVAEIMNLWDEPRVKRVVKCWAPQTTKTMSSYLPILRRLSRGQGPALMVMSSEAMARKMFKEYVLPICQASPGLQDLLSGSREDTTSATIKLIGNRGRFDAAWATSLHRLKSFSYRITLGDEVEDWPHDVDGGGDPEALMDVRMRFFPHSSRMELVSSPGNPARTWAKMLGCQQLWVLMARCPHCRVHQRIVWPEENSPWHPRWVYDSGMDPARIEGEYLAAYICAGCDNHWGDGDRDRAVREGKWQSVHRRFLENKELWDHPFPEPTTDTVIPISVGTHLPAWYSRLVPLAKVVAERLRAENEPDPVNRAAKLRAWVNNYPAHPNLDEETAAIEEKIVISLKDDRPEGIVPTWALGLLLTADVQGNGVWYEVRAWDNHGTSACVQYGFIPKGALAVDVDIDGNEFMGTETGGQHSGIVLGDDLVALAGLAQQTWKDINGNQYAVRFGLVDSGFRTDEVYDLCRLQRNLAPSKGTDSSARRSSPLSYHDVDKYPGTKRRLPVPMKLVIFSADVWKDALSRRLQVPFDRTGAWLLHHNTTEDYIKHYQGESRDELSGSWEQIGRQPNHLWDCGVLQLVAWEILRRPPYNLWDKIANNGGVISLPGQSNRPITSPAVASVPRTMKQRSKLW